MMPSTRLARLLTERGLTLSTAESCTGGGLSHVLTSIPGSSAFFVGGVIAYQNDVKAKFLGVSAETLRDFGAVSAETATAMANGCKSLFATDVSVSITGIAGPSGGTPTKPVGLVFLASATHSFTSVEEHHFSGNREQIRDAAIEAAIGLILRAIDQKEK